MAEAAISADREITLTRMFDAPRDLVFKAWTDPQRVAQWWGPQGFTTPVCEMDARPGGAIRIVMRAPDGTDYPMTGAFREIATPERLVSTNSCADRDGHALLEGLTVVRFEAQGSKTSLTLRARATALAPAAAQMLAGMEEGWRQTLDRLADHLVAQTMRPAERSADRELSITRLFDAPRALVFKAWTEPERAVRWWGPRGFTIAHCEMDTRPGGAYRICMRSPEGAEHWQRGVCREIVAPERLVFTFAWEDAEGRPGHETMVTVTFAEDGGKTRLTLRQAVFETVTARDLHQGGWTSALECLAEYLAQS
jgi:uncharacterized protein YndB with AHSA1/START domain